MLSTMTSALDVLSDPVRLRVVRHLEGGADASLQELADAAGVHLNTVRVHVGALEAAGALDRASAARAGRGRPQVRWRLASGWTVPTSDFRGLAEVLAAILVRRGADAEDVRAVGIEWGRYLLGRPGAREIEHELPRALEQLGFSVRIADRTLELSACPCSIVLPDRPELICELAVAVVDGVLAGAGSELRVSERSHDTGARACRAHLAPPPAAGRTRRRSRRGGRIRRRPGHHDA
jgi:predicted ArsR family transcriptional regulator